MKKLFSVLLLVGLFFAFHPTAYAWQYFDLSNFQLSLNSISFDMSGIPSTTDFTIPLWIGYNGTGAGVNCADGFGLYNNQNFGDAFFVYDQPTVTYTSTHFSAIDNVNPIWDGSYHTGCNVHLYDSGGTGYESNQVVDLGTPPPSVGSSSVSPNPVQVNTATTASASFTYSNTTDTHTAQWNWGDGNTTTGTVTESNGSGSVSDTHTYAATGVYTITLTVTDNHGATGTSTYQYVAVYDSTTSFAGGHSFDNPTSASPNTTGKVSFGISAKYNNSNVLTGSVKMNFKAANLDFASISLSSLATSNGKAYLKGSGTLNGNSGYTFLASGIDGSVVGGNDLIRFQIKDSSNTVVYDSQPGAGDTIDPTTTDASGNIRVH